MTSLKLDINKKIDIADIIIDMLESDYNPDGEGPFELTDKELQSIMKLIYNLQNPFNIKLYTDKVLQEEYIRYVHLLDQIQNTLITIIEEKDRRLLVKVLKNIPYKQISRILKDLIT